MSNQWVRAIKERLETAEGERDTCDLCLRDVCVMFQFCLLLNFTSMFSWFPPPSCPSLKCVTLVPKHGKEEGLAVREPSPLRNDCAPEKCGTGAVARGRRTRGTPAVRMKRGEAVAIHQAVQCQCLALWGIASRLAEDQMTACLGTGEPDFSFFSLSCCSVSPACSFSLPSSSSRLSFRSQVAGPLMPLWDDALLNCWP